MNQKLLQKEVTKMKKAYTVKLTVPDFKYETIFKKLDTNNFEQALRVYDKFKMFAEKHNLTLNVSLYINYQDNPTILQTEIINPTKTIEINK